MKEERKKNKNTKKPTKQQQQINGNWLILIKKARFTVITN